MPLTAKLLTASLTLLAALTVLFAAAWLRARADYTRARQTIASDQLQLEQLAKRQQALSAQLAQVQADAQNQLDALHKDYDRAQSPKQVADLLSRTMHLPDPIQIVALPGGSGTAKSPVAPGRASAAETLLPSTGQSVAQIPLPDAPQAKAYVLSCEECSIRLTAQERQASLAAQQLAAAKQQLALTQHERDAWKRAAAGGSWPRRALKRATAFAIDAAIAGAALCATGHCR